MPPRPHQRALTRLVSRAVDAVVAVTQRQVPPLEALGYPRGRIDVVPNGVFERDVEGVEPSPRARARTASPSCAWRGCGPRSGWTCSSRRSPPLAARTRPSAATWPARGRSASGSSGSAGGSGVALLGVRRDVLELIRAADAVCLPSEAEALPMSILEAMALGRPVVATRRGRHRRAGGGRRDRLPRARRRRRRRSGARCSSSRPTPSAPARWARPGRRRQRERFSGEAMVDGYLRAFEEAIRRGQA